MLHSELLTLSSISLASLSLAPLRVLCASRRGLMLRLRGFRTSCPGTRARRLRGPTASAKLTSLTALLNATLELSVQLPAKSTGSCCRVVLRDTVANGSARCAARTRCSCSRRSRSADATRPPGETDPRSWLEAFMVIRRSGDTVSLGRVAPGWAARRAAALGVLRSSEPMSDVVDIPLQNAAHKPGQQISAPPQKHAQLRCACPPPPEAYWSTHAGRPTNFGSRWLLAKSHVLCSVSQLQLEDE